MVPRPTNGLSLCAGGGGLDMTCSVYGCEKRLFAKGLCQSHYERLRRHGDPLGGRVSPGVAMGFLTGAVSTDTDDCIEWPFASTGGGYGKISIDGELVSVPSEVLLRSGRTKPSPRHVAAHAPKVCHNRKCINPRHLRWATASENAADKILDGTDNRGSSHGNHKLHEPDIPKIRDDCRAPKAIADEIGVSEATIRDVITRRTWSHIK